MNTFLIKYKVVLIVDIWLERFIIKIAAICFCYEKKEIKRLKVD